MKWLTDQISRIHVLVALPPLFILILATDVFAYFAGLLFWYGDVMANPFMPAPIWTWPFIPDCPLAGLLGGLGLLMVTAHKFWSPQAQARTRRYLLIIGGVSLLLWLSTYLPGAPVAWSRLSATLAVWSWSLLLAGAFFHQAPPWLLGLFAFGQIKYGIWTVTAWTIYWRNTALMLGAPDFNPMSVLMTVSHIALVGQGIFLLTYFKPDARAALVSFVWYALSDFVDYGLGWFPSLPLTYIPLAIMQWHTIVVTVLLSALYTWFSRQPSRATPQASRLNKGRSGQLTHPSV